MDASLCLWTGDPFTDKRAEPAWIFVDGFATKRELKAKKGKGASAEGPDEGVDATGTWTITVDSDDAPESAVLTLVMEEDGAVTGRYAIALRTGMAGESDVEGSVSGDEMTLRGVFALEEAEIEFELTATIAGDAMTGTSVVTMPWAEESVSSSFTAAKTPERDGGVR